MTVIVTSFVNSSTVTIVVGKPFALMKTTLEKFSCVFQILVVLDTIYD